MDRRALLGSGVALPLAAWALLSISVPRTDWRIAQSQGLEGMHLLAAGFYGLMQATGHAATGGNLADWTLKCLAGGRLTVDRLDQEASALLGFDVRTWTP